ncbi:MAG: hypothetical protein VX617_03595 [Pseudomonadota bacterium]|nr:hypothetical protein [Pseudomonadota bacterium]
MGEVIKAEWFDLAKDEKDQIWRWLHNEYLPVMQSTSGVSWIGHYEIEKHPDRPYIDGAPMKKQTSDLSVPKGWENVILTAAISPEVFFGPNNSIDRLIAANTQKLEKRENFRDAVFIEELVINSPEQHIMPYGMGPPPAMQLGNYNTDTPEDQLELAKWYREERFPRVSVSRGMIRGRKMLSITGWPKHGVLWEFTELPQGEFSFEPRFVEADRSENWQGRHVLEYVTHAPGSPHAGRLVWPALNL